MLFYVEQIGFKNKTRLICSNGFCKYVDFIQYIFNSLESKVENDDDDFE